MRETILWVLLSLLLMGSTVQAQHSIAREWNEILLESIRSDYARPTIHARNLFHISMAMYDAWAVYDSKTSTYFLGQTVDNYICPFNGISIPGNIEAAQKETLSYAVYRLFINRFKYAPGYTQLKINYDNFMVDLGYDINFTSEDYSTGSPAALVNPLILH